MSSKLDLSLPISVWVVALTSGCTHTLAFSEPTPIVVTGTPPAPPVPPPATPQPKVTLPAVPAAAVAPKRVEVQKDQIVIHDKIQFERNQAGIKAESNALLDEIADVVRTTPQIGHLSIEGHTDSTGNAARNQRLSEQRAAAVQDYLVQRGISTERLSSKGWGPTRPLADNASEAGREQNRRVEFVILEQAEVISSGGDGQPTVQPRIVPETRPSEGADDMPALPRSGAERDLP
jgi:outer membrane protein OmpA-like peptidoglycan-associated protein